MTAVFVTQDMSEAFLLADRIAVMHAGELLQVGSAQTLLKHPAHANFWEAITNIRASKGGRGATAEIWNESFGRIMSEFTQQLTLLPELLSAHLTLSLTALGLGTAISLPLAALAARRPRLQQVALGLASVIQKLPSLALLAIMGRTLARLSLVTAPFTGVPLKNLDFRRRSSR